MLFKILLWTVLLYFPLKWLSSLLIKLSIEDRILWRKIKNIILVVFFFLIYSMFLIEKSPEMILGKFVSSLLVAVLIILFLGRKKPGHIEILIRGFFITTLFFIFLFPFLSVGNNIQFKYLNVGLREEGFKFLCVFSLFLIGKVKDEKDAIIAGASVGGIFGSLENYFYGESFGFGIFALRNLLPTHIVINAVMGYFFFLGAKEKGVKKLVYLSATIAIPLFLHWAFDFSLQFNKSIYPYIGLDLLLLAWVYMKSSSTLASENDNYLWTSP